MKLVFNDAQVLNIQTAQDGAGYLRIKVIGISRQDILDIFQNTEKTRKMTVVNEGKSTVYEGYAWDALTEYTGKVYEVAMAAPGQTFEERLDNVERSAEDLTLMMAELIGGGEG